VIGNPAHDIIRLGLSLASAARGSNLPGVTTARILEQLVAGYEKALSDDIELGMDKSDRPERIQDLLEHSIRRRWRHLALERLETVKPVLPLGEKFWAPLASAKGPRFPTWQSPQIHTGGPSGTLLALASSHS
jgi:uncharacterized protein (DUF2252 family)